MVPVRSTLPAWLVLSTPMVLACMACGGTVVFEEDGGGGQGGDGGASVVSSSGPTTSVTTTAGNVTVSVTAGPVAVSTGEGAGPSAVTTVSSGEGGGVPADCASHSIYTECLAHGECVPIFDDRCCSDCFPREGCADCIDVQFVGCTERFPPEPGGRCGATPCGFIPEWACNGAAPVCDRGCAEAGCVSHLKCDIDVCESSCSPVAPDACGPVSCDGLPPDCFGNQVPEVSNGCWTGACIPSWVCAVQPPL